MALISVIITTFDRSSLLKEAIRSVLNQDFSDFELIVIDDASSDEGIAQVFNSFTDARIHYVRNNKNEGSAASLNIGLGQATGKYVAILDDDDAWQDSQKLSKQVEFLKSHRDYVLVGTNAIVVNSETKEEMTRTNFPSEDAVIRQTIFRANPFAHSSVMFVRESALSVGGYDETLSRGKDYELMLKLGKIGKVTVLPDYTLMYREAMPKNSELIKRRLKDAEATRVVLWKHKGEYSGFWGAYMRVLSRVYIFRILTIAPFFYTFYRKDGN